MQIVVNSLLTNYMQSGAGQVVLLLHGWGDDQTTFSGLMMKLSNKYKLISIDLPGFGKTEPPKDVWTLDNYAGFVNAFLDKLKIGQVYAIIGHSNGGALAIRGLAQGKLNAEKLILLASSGVRNSHTAKRFAIKTIAKTGKVATFWLPYGKRQALRKKLYGVVGSDMLVAPHLQETFKNTVRQDIQNDAKILKLPTLLIYGDKDKATPLSDGKILANHIKGSKLEVISGAGHFVYQDEPDKVETIIKEFLL